jgi:hypothetical protein
MTMRRRDVLAVGALGGAWSLARHLRAEATTPVAHGRSGILVFLAGGPSHQDTFDLKPDAPAEYRGEFKPIATRAPGVEICEHLPKLARAADRYCLVRGVTHNLADHGLGTKYLLTGNRPAPLVPYPTFGAAVGKELPAPHDVPPFVAVPEDPVGPGFLGSRFGALATGERPNAYRPFSVRGISVSDSLTIDRLGRRRALADDLDTAFRGFDELDDEVVGLDRFAQQAHEIIVSPRARTAFDLEQEPRAILDRFGNDETGRTFLAACRLIEAGVRFVTISIDGWDTHQNNFRELKTKLLPSLDRSLTALLDTLRERGLDESTTTLVTGEFGRTPKVNGNAGRDHWARAMFCLFAGGGVKGGQVLGASDDKAAEPADKGFSPDDVAATFYRRMGIDPSLEYHTPGGRPITLVRDGRDLPIG